MTYFTRFAAIGLLFIVMNKPFCQKTHVPEFIEWNEITNSMRFSEKFSLYTELQLRFVYNNNLFQTLQHQFRVAPEIHVDKHFSIQPIAYVYTINGHYENNPKPYGNNEHRIYSQMSYKHHVGRVHLQHRLRYEWRFSQSNSLDSLGNTIYDDTYGNYKNRIRYRISANIPINHKDLEPNTWYIRAWDEFMVGFADPIRYPTYKVEDNIQNRVFLGAGYQIIKNISVTLGALYQMQMKSNGTYVEHNIGTFLSVNFNPDFRKLFKKKDKETTK
jgi:hypothetical protein